MKIVTERKRHEMNETLREEGIDEHGNEGEVTIRFWNKDTEDPWSMAYVDEHHLYYIQCSEMFTLRYEMLHTET